MLVLDTSHSEEDCYWQDIICKRKSERQRAPEMAEQVCTYLPALPGIRTERREYRIIKVGAFTVDLEWEFIRHYLVLVNRKDFQKIISISNLLIVVDAG